MWTLRLSRALIAGIILAAEAAALDADTKAMVEAFLKMPVEQMPPDHIGRFMAVKAEDLPEKLRPKFEARKLELSTLRHISATKKKGFVRMPEKDCAVPDDTKAAGAAIFKLAGYGEIDEAEVLYLTDRTKCTVEELMCEFSLRVVVEKAAKGKKKTTFMLHQNDVLWGMIAQYRSGSKGTQTNFFGLGGGPVCSR